MSGLKEYSSQPKVEIQGKKFVDEKMKYLVVYTFGVGVGSVDVNFRHFPPTMKDIRDAEREIRKINGFEKNPVIVNWLEITEDS